MRRYLIILCLSIIPVLPLAAQNRSRNHPQNQWYRTLSGILDKNTSLTLSLVRVNDSLYGDYWYSGNIPGTAGDHAFAGYPKPVFGRISASGSFQLRQWPGDEGPVIKGIYRDDRPFSVLWSILPGNPKPAVLQLSKTDPEGAVPFILFFLGDQQSLTNDAGSPRAKIKLAMLLPQGSTADTLKSVIMGKYTSRPLAGLSPAAALADARQEFFSDYQKTNQALYKSAPGASFNWELLKFTHIVYNAHRKVCFYILTYSFTGGAHGMEMQEFSTVDLQSGKTLKLEDLFKTGSEKELTRLLTHRLHQMINQPESGKLSESGYFTDEVKPTENFYLNDNGIGFFYNHYEIAPYSFGATDIFLSKEELRQILKQPL